MTNKIGFAEFRERIKEIYGPNNDKKDFEYLYSYLCRNSSYLSRSILRSGNSIPFFISSFSWLVASADKLDIDIGEAFRKKFPQACPYCIAAPCQCNETHRTPINNLPIHEARHELKQEYLSDKNVFPLLTIDQATKRIAKIYPANKAIWQSFGSFYHFSRLFEELGEVHEAYSAFNKTGEKVSLEEEFADVTAWLLSAWNLQRGEASLSDAILDYYIDNCPVCKKCPCECKDYSDRPQMLSDKQTLSDLKNKIQELLELDPAYKSQLRDLLGTVDSAMNSTSTVDAKNAFTQAKAILKKIEDTVTSVENITDKSGKIMTSIKVISSIIMTAKSYWS